MVIRITILFFILLISCRAPKVETSKVTKDSIHVREIPRLQTVHVPGAKVKTSTYVLCDSITNKPVPVSGSAENDGAFVHYAIDETGKLDATGGCDSLKRQVLAKDLEIFHMKYNSESKTETRIAYRSRWYDIACRWFTLLVVLALVIRYRKLFKKLLPI